MSAHLKTKIDKWLRQIGCTPVEQEDPMAAWHFAVDYPAKSPDQTHVLVPALQPDRVTILTGTEISHEHRQGI